MKQFGRFALIIALAAACVAAQDPDPGARHVVVHKEEGRFAGWPANHGIWSWGDEIVAGFELGYFKENRQGHAIDYERPAEHLLARSMDGGETWTVERPEGLRPPPGVKVAGVPAGTGGREAVDCPGGIDFAHPGFAMTFRMTSHQVGESRFYYSLDRGRTWQGPYRFPQLGQPGIMARTDYLVNGKHELMAFVTAAKRNKREGRPVVARTYDGGKSWNFVSYIGPEVEDYAIMPSSLRLGPAEIVSAIRRRHWIDVWRSNDNGDSWQFLNQAVVVTGGNPPHLVDLGDGRIVLTYGYRRDPAGIRARVSHDHGLTWSQDIILRQDGGNWDLGYTRTVKRADGKLVTVYYFNEDAGAERYIGATIWDPSGY